MSYPVSVWPSSVDTIYLLRQRSFSRYHLVRQTIPCHIRLVSSGHRLSHPVPRCTVRILLRGVCGGEGAYSSFLASITRPLTTHPFRDGAPFALLTEASPTFGRSVRFFHILLHKHFLRREAGRKTGSGKKGSPRGQAAGGRDPTEQ